MSEPAQQDEPGADPTMNLPSAASNLDTAPENSSFDRIIPRLLKSIAVLTVIFLCPTFWFYGWVGAIGFALGATLSYINFRSLSQGVEALTARVVDQHSSEKGGRIIMRFVLRYVLVGIVAYAIFRGSTQAFRGFLWGLCVPAAALMIEAGWQGWKAFRSES